MGGKRKGGSTGHEYVLRVEQVRGYEECEGFAVLIEHMPLRVNNDIFDRGENPGNDLQLS